MAKKPAWKENQQKTTGSEKAKPTPKATKGVKILMKTGYMHYAKAGQVWETDTEKAAELVKLGRATYVKGK